MAVRLSAIRVLTPRKILALISVRDRETQKARMLLERLGKLKTKFERLHRK
jgi:hypothetical protein